MVALNGPTTKRARERERETSYDNIERVNGHYFRLQYPMSCGDDERDVTLRLSRNNKPLARKFGLW